MKYIIPSILLIFCLFLILIMLNNKLYCRIFLSKDWNWWEKIIKKFDSVEYLCDYNNEEEPHLENYTFIIILDEKFVHIKYWKLLKTVSVHYLPDDGCLGDFDKYHQKVIKRMLHEKFDFIPKDI